MTSGYKDIGIRRSEFFLHLIFSVLKLWSRNEKYEFSQGNFPAKTRISLIVQKFVTRFFLLKSNLCTVLNKLTPRTISQMRAYTFLPVQCRVAPDPLKSDLSSSNAILHNTGKNVHPLIWLMLRGVSSFKAV